MDIRPLPPTNKIFPESWENTLRQFQKKDLFCNTIIIGLKKGDPSLKDFELKDNLLHYRINSHKTKPIATVSSLQFDLFFLHNECKHLKLKEVHRVFSKRIFFPNLIALLKHFIYQCEECITFNMPHIGLITEISTILDKKRNDFVAETKSQINCNSPCLLINCMLENALVPESYLRFFIKYLIHRGSVTARSAIEHSLRPTS